MDSNISDDAEKIPVDFKQRAILKDIIQYYFEEYDPLEPDEVATLNRNKQALENEGSLYVTPSDTELFLQLMQEFARDLKIELEDEEPEERKIIFEFFEPVFQELSSALEDVGSSNTF